ncbi:uroporphyrinogen-III C-methyltransferase [Thermus scotoductus]|uniref:uroporphyrinogen-III C-methyltransferase n=1 Tax=Thermus scotoductus TaxID=37636 RepID=A0A430S116_THESC|nr:uroporphyrinogen-III C-methyltransferase [Thermus scotoductus]RTH27266.1 uroporphyrinogen-III C-methyltransferase [Thermus scotoductus]RTI42676.1 uroporphyrinogen-III C-methyltransferase [Thermus scotoductus]
MGRVYLVGAGPGDPELLTLKAYRLLKEAPVVLHDRLVDERILALAPGEKVYVGKEEGESGKQEEIHRLLLRYARAYPKVVRLKGGDPFVFGRGGEEMLFLLRHGIPVEVVPGVTSLLASGLPLTHRGLAHGFAAVSGVLEDGGYPDLRAFAQVPTLVVLMGVKRRAWIAKELIRLGRRPDEPTLFVMEATTPRESRVPATLEDVAEGKVEVAAPAVWVIGKVVEVFDILQKTPQAWALAEV